MFSESWTKAPPLLKSLCEGSVRITIETTLAAPVEEVWQAWTTSEDIVRWNAASDDWHCPSAEIDLRPGGRCSYRMEARDGSMGFDFDGTFVRVVPHQAIEFALTDDRSVTVQFLAGENEVTVRESFDAESAASAEPQLQGWHAILDRFAGHVETGDSEA